MDDQRNERKKKLLLKSEERLERITGQSQVNSLQLQNFKKQEVERTIESESDSVSGDSTGLMPAVPLPPTKTLREEDFFRDLLTWIHTLMLIVLGIFSHAAFHQSCEPSCFFILNDVQVPSSCKDHLVLGRLFLYGGLFSIETPFLFLTIKSYKSIGPRVFLRILSGICLYITSHIAAALAYYLVMNNFNS